MVAKVSSCHRDQIHKCDNVHLYTKITCRDFSDTILLDDDFVDAVFYSLKFHPTDMWLDHQGRPHVMFCLEHDCESDERLLPGELLAIVAIMLTRLRHPSFKSHSIIPVSHNIINGKNV